MQRSVEETAPYSVLHEEHGRKGTDLTARDGNYPNLPNFKGLEHGLPLQIVSVSTFSHSTKLSTAPSTHSRTQFSVFSTSRLEEYRDSAEELRSRSINSLPTFCAFSPQSLDIDSPFTVPQARSNLSNWMADGPVLQQGDGWGQEGGLKDDPAVPVHQQQPLRTKAAKTEELSFTEWLERYSIGRIGPADQAPLPPPSILAILNGREPPPQPSPVSTTSSVTSSPVSLPTSLPSPSLDSSPILPQIALNKPKRGPISLSITLSHGSSRASSAASIDSTSTGSLFNPAVTEEHATALLNHFREKGTFPAPPGPWEEERLRLAHKYGLDQPVRRKAIDRICAIAKAHFKTKMVVVSL